MLPAPLRDLAEFDLADAVGDLARCRLCLVLAHVDMRVDGLAPASAQEILAAARYPDGAAGPRGRGHILRRRIARTIAAGHWGIAADRLSIAADRLGKPAFRVDDGDGAIPPLHLSFAARGDHGLIGIAAMPIGVDLEQAIPADAIPKNVLRPDEIAVLARLSPADRQDKFMEIWCVKEAFLKSVGQGFNIPPERVALSDQKAEFKYSIILENEGHKPHEISGLASFVKYLASSGPDEKKLFGIAVSLLSK